MIFNDFHHFNIIEIQPSPRPPTIDFPTGAININSPNPFLSALAFCSVKDYDYIWKDLKTLPHISKWGRVLLPTLNVFDMGASEYIYSSLNREIIFERTSPIVFMRAEKNEVEREGMRRAHIRDAVAMCDTFSYLEERVC